MTRASDVGACAAEWVQRRHFHDWSEQDQAELDAWLAEASINLVTYLRLEAAWSRTERLVALQPSGREEARASRTFRRILFGVAGGLGVLAIIGVGVSLLMMPGERTYSTPVGGHEIVTLADGSRIELNTDTVLRARMDGHERKIMLEKGEAFFQVRHDAAHPFVVMAGDHRVTDMGTKFLIRRDTQRLEVAVMEGRVRFDATDGLAQAQASLLTQGDAIVATTNAVSLMRQSTQKLANELGWRRGVVVFRHMTLGDAAIEFNRYNAKKLVVADAEAAHLKIDGIFPTNNVEQFSHLVQVALGLRVENRGNEIVISR